MQKRKFLGKIELRARVEKNTDIIFTSSYKKFLLKYLKKRIHNKLFFITDEAIINQAEIVRLFPKSSVFILGRGENTKNFNNLHKILNFFYNFKVDRKSLVVVIGGGVVTDIAGLACSIYYRGLSAVFVPTTLLSQVDASIGGKNAINYKNSKNIIGTVFLPELIIIDSSVLKTLPQKQFRSGISEIIKYAIGFDKRLIKVLEDDQNFYKNINYLIYRSVLIKINLVKKDLFERGKKRKLLNLGHTLGQVLETEKNYSLTHGEAVSIGLLFSSYISMKRRLLTDEEFILIVSLFKKYKLSPVIHFNRKKILEKMRHDKKSYSDSVDFILIKKIGKSIICNVSYRDIELYMKEFQKFYYNL